MAERRLNPRVQLELPVFVWGVDAQSFRYSQQAVARSISFGGALISGIELRLRPGDLIGIQYGDNRAHFRVVWARDSEGALKNQAAVQRMDDSECPWKELLEKSIGASASGQP